MLELTFTIFVLSLFPRTGAAIGPVADLEIVNKVISPDGFNRSCVLHFSREICEFIPPYRTVLAGGTYPGPLIRGNKVLYYYFKMVFILVFTDGCREIDSC
jgi:iron transport multicopper oxidase